MDDFVGYACWDPASVSRTIKTEAITPSDAVFLATHSPLRIRRQMIMSDELSDESLISEAQLVDEFLNAPAREGFLVAAVLGDSGTGKSHLVRWAQANIEPTRERVVIYLPKAKTGLREVIEKLLEYGSGPEIDKIRIQISKLGSGVDQEQLERRLLNELAESIRTAEPRSPFEKALVGQDKLHALLHDPFFMHHFLAPGSFVNRRAMHALGMVDADGGDVPLQFTRNDLPIDIANVSQAAELTKSVYRQLVSQQPMQKAAIDLLNRHVDVAVMRATELGVGQLQKAFLRLRQELAGKQEIILLIEDFALIQGVQRDLLDAIVQAGEERGRQAYATIRTLMAVTPGYYRDELPATFQTRAQASSPLYELDVTLRGKGSLSRAEVSSFVGRYLNAARLGTEYLEASQIQRGHDVPNKCTACEFQEECFAAFDSSAEGYGLYPYNQAALERAVFGSTLPEQPANFNPRRVLSLVVRSVLTEQVEDLENGQFPSHTFRQTFAHRAEMPMVPPEVGNALLEVLGDTEAQRMVTVLEFWGGAPQDLVDVPSGIRRAFQLPVLPQESISAWAGGATGVATTGGAGQAGGLVGQQPPADREALDPSLQRQLEAIDSWAKRGVDLPQEVARVLRSIVVIATMAQVSWVDPVMKAVPASRNKWVANQASTISIEGAKESLGTGVQPLLRFERNDANAVFFKALILLNAGHAAGAEKARIRLDSLAAELAPKAQAAIIEGLRFDDESLADVMAVLLDGAAACGRLGPSSTTLQQVEAIFWDGSSDSREDRPWRQSHWIDQEDAHRIERSAVVGQLREAVGTSQGAGAVHAIDFVRVHGLLKQAVKRQGDVMLTDLPEWARKAAKPVERLRLVVDMQAGEFRSHLESIRHLVPRGTSYTGTVSAISSATKAGQTLGFVPAEEDLSDVHARNSMAMALDFKSVETMEKMLDRFDASDNNERLALLGTDFGDSPLLILEYLRFTDDWVTKGQRRADSQGTPDASDLDKRIQDVVNRWESLADPESEV